MNSNKPTPPQSLFRNEAVQYAGNQQFGTVILARFVSHEILTGFFVILAAAVVSFFVFFETTRKVRCVGVLMPTSGVMRVVSTQVGLITESRVAEGQQVLKDDILFVLSSERGSARDASTERTISNLLEDRRNSFANEVNQLASQARQRIKSKQDRIRDLSNEAAQLRAQLELQRSRILISEQAYTRYEELLKTNYVSQAQLQDKQADVLDQRQRLADMQRAISALTRDLENEKASLIDLQIQAQRDAAGLLRSISTLEQDLSEHETRREFLVRAPRSGTVTAITARAGQTVTTNTALATMLPAGAALEAEVYAPSRSVGFIKPGMTVMLRYQAYPYQKFGQYRAMVREVANMSLRPEDLNVPVSVDVPGEPVYRIRLQLESQTVVTYGKEMPLKSGMMLEASVELEHRRLYEWIFEPLFSIAGKL